MGRWEIYLHLVWATKHREALLTLTKEEIAYRAIRAIVEAEGYEVLDINGMPDHIHLLIKAKTKLDITYLMQRVKGSVSALLTDIAKQDEQLRWQEGYFAASVTPSQVPKIRAYIQNQKQHHSEQTTHSFWENTGTDET
ncbi:MAG: IS200/IS605 family transposase [Armatimonadetes bacterium]|nr:IS200/IS605 family transposase [Armatimonadota bacterium]